MYQIILGGEKEMVEENSRFQIMDPQEKEEIEQGHFHFLGEFYLDYGKWGLKYDTVDLSRAECEAEGLLWLQGECFNLPSTVEIKYYREKRVPDGVIIYNYFYRIKS